MKVLMFAHGGSLNRGCEAIVRSSTEIIKERIKESKVYLASSKPDSDRIISNLDGIFDSSPVVIRKYSLQWFISLINVKLFNNESYPLGVIEGKIIRRMRNMDVCLSIGGDNYCYGEQPGLFEIDRRAKKQGKKLVLWGCSIGEEDLTENTIEDLKLFDLILARETITYNTLLQKGLKNVKLCADPAFTMNKEDLPLPEGWQEGNTVGLNFSPLVMNMNKVSKDSIRNLIKHIIISTDMTIALTPHVIINGNNDHKLLKEYYNEFRHSKRVILLPDNLTAPQYKGYISRMRYFIGARTHATIAAYSSFVPTMVLGYSVKSRGIAKDIFGREKLVLKLQELSNSNRVIEMFDEMVENEDSIKEQLLNSIPQIKIMSYQAVEHLNKIVK